MSRKSLSDKKFPIRLYGTVEAFLSALSQGETHIEILLMPIAHRLTLGTGTTRTQVAILLTGQRANVVYVCFVLVAEASSVGEKGRIIYPYKASDDPHVTHQLQRLQDELLTVLTTAFQRDSRVSSVEHPAALEIPQLRTWPSNALTHFPIVFRDGHWVSVEEEHHD